MDSLLLALPALGCVVMMPLMMWLMSRSMGNRHDAGQQQQDPGEQARAEELSRLRDEVARLRSDVDAESGSRGPAGG
jgi:hypothetical protein